MGDILGIIVLILFYAVAAAGRAKKKQAQQESRTPKKTISKANTRQFEQAFARTDNSTQTVGSARAAGASKPVGDAEPAVHESGRCEQKPLHLHEVTQRQLSEAGEGEDPCHAGGAPRRVEKPILTEETDEPNPLAQDVLRGVIMSEILQRPCERMAARRYGRRV